MDRTSKIVYALAFIISGLFAYVVVYGDKTEYVRLVPVVHRCDCGASCQCEGCCRKGE